MDVLTVAGGLAHIGLIRGVREATPDRICVLAGLKGLPGFAGLEALAQTAAWHARFAVDFKRHAFLLTLTRGKVAPGVFFDSDKVLRARLLGQTERARTYDVAGAGGGGPWPRARVVIGVRDYDERFRACLLEPYYRKGFACLRNALTTL